MTHTPVLSHEVVELLAPAPGALLLDCTVGGGGHAALLLERAQPGGRLIGIDRDPVALEYARARLAPFGDAVTLMHGSFRDLPTLVDARSFKETSVVLADLGISSFHIDAPDRGFTFQVPDAPLDMRMDQSADPHEVRHGANTLEALEGCSAALMLRDASESLLIECFRRYGEIRPASRLAAAIVAARRTRPLQTAGDLVEVVHAVMKPHMRERHPEAQVFQALRIAVNGELRQLEELLAVLLDRLSAGTRIGIITFHSLEDRIVKHAFARAARDCICPPELPACMCGGNRSTLRLLTRRAIHPTEEEVARNPRARSALLRVAQIC